MNEALLILKSVHHGNTRSVAERIAKVLGAPIADPDQSLPSCLSEARLVGFGSGVYYGRFHHALRRWITNLPKDCGIGRLAFVYSTSGLPFLSAIYHRPLVRALEQRGFEVIGEFACRGHDTFGPLWLFGGINRKHPDADDLARAESFAAKIAELASEKLPGVEVAADRSNVQHEQAGLPPTSIPANG